MLGGDGHWTDAAPRPGVFTRNADGLAAAARAHGARRSGQPQCSSFMGCRSADWQGASFVLSTATGKTELVDNLAHLWATAEKLIGRPCDPLDPA